jgi:hypothetical protein
MPRLQSPHKLWIFSFAACRASFYLTHAKVAANTKPVATHGSHDTAPQAAAAGPLSGVYTPYLHECIERDGSKTVGLGLSMWILMLAFVLLSGTTGCGFSKWLSDIGLSVKPS